jgi:fermentation-respiration switch protein FrsA (DUF1100 family)
VLRALENRFLFPAVRAAVNWTAAPPELNARDVEVVSSDGTRIHCWWCAPDGWTPGRGSLLYCHGNGENLSLRGPILLRWQQKLGVAVLIFDYPGYGKSGGKPTEAGCYAAADAAYLWLTKMANLSAEQIVLYGGSLGGAVAIDVALRLPCRALITVAAFTSVPDMAQRLFWWLPVRWLVRNRFDNLKKIAGLRRPIFLAHGTADRLVPFRHAERLFAAADAPKHFFPMPGYDHYHTPGPEFYEAVAAFLGDNP